MGRHQRGDGRRRATSRFKVIRVAASVVDFCGSVIDYVAALLHPEAGFLLALDPPSASAGISLRRMCLAKGRADGQHRVTTRRTVD
jgi:hypothetical protein